jgi:molybdopterin biosynthesis enzyme
VGVGEVRVLSRPRVRLLITGNELLPCGSQPRGYRIVDANGPMLAALVARDGGLVDFPGLVPDEHDAIRNALHADTDVVIVSGGSSVGLEDLVRRFSHSTATWPSTGSPCVPVVLLPLGESSIARVSASR